MTEETKFSESEEQGLGLLAKALKEAEFLSDNFSFERIVFTPSFMPQDGQDPLPAVRVVASIRFVPTLVGGLALGEGDRLHLEAELEVEMPRCPLLEEALFLSLVQKKFFPSAQKMFQQLSNAAALAYPGFGDTA